MPLNIQDLIDLLAEICEEKKLQVAVKESLKGGLVTGFSALAGGLLLGPVGLALGGAVGGGVTALSARNKFESVAVILKKMSHDQKQQLLDRLLHAFRNFGPQDIASLSMLILSAASLKEIAINEVKSFLASNMSAVVQ